MTPALKNTVPNGLIIAADMFVVIHVLGSFQVYSMPVCTRFFRTYSPAHSLQELSP